MECFGFMQQELTSGPNVVLPTVSCWENNCAQASLRELDKIETFIQEMGKADEMLSRNTPVSRRGVEKP